MSLIRYRLGRIQEPTSYSELVVVTGQAISGITGACLPRALRATTLSDLRGPYTAYERNLLATEAVLAFAESVLPCAVRDALFILTAYDEEVERGYAWSMSAFIKSHVAVLSDQFKALVMPPPMNTKVKPA